MDHCPSPPLSILPTPLQCFNVQPATHCSDYLHNTPLHMFDALIPSHFKDSLANYNLKHRISKKNFDTKA